MTWANLPIADRLGQKIGIPGIAVVDTARAFLESFLAGRRPSVLLNSLPKSGGVYVREALRQILRARTMYLGCRYALIGQIDVKHALRFASGGYVSQNHLAPSPENLQILQHLKQKVVLHLRDPREALLSWVHHLDRVTARSDESVELLYVAPRPQAGYFALPLMRKIDWQLEHYLPQMVAWATRWVEVADRKTIPILITLQHDLKRDERAFFGQILDFYDFDRDYNLPKLPRTLNDTHFRLADPDEWRRTFTLDQMNRANAMIPPLLRRRFGWDAGA
jgi:hypothetical protein